MSNQKQENRQSLAEIAKDEKEANEILDDLENKAKNLLKTAGSFYKDVNTFNSRVEDIAVICDYRLPAGVYGTRELNANLMLRVFAMASDQGHNLGANIEAAAVDLDGLLRDVRAEIEKTIAQTKKTIIEKEVLHE